jgi:hypothetical protein
MTTPTHESIGRRVRERRGTLYSQQHLGTLMREAGHRSWDASVVSKIELGQRRLSLLEARSVVEILGCTLAHLLETDAEDYHRAMQALRDRARQPRGGTWTKEELEAARRREGGRYVETAAAVAARLGRKYSQVERVRQGVDL